MKLKNHRKIRVTNKIMSSATRPRMVIFRSNKEIYASIIDNNGKVVANASSIKLSGMTKTAAAEKVGADIASKAKAGKVTEIVFDRRGYKYHGRVKALAEGAREGGLKF
ncbi:MAG: 50S ribosomal protein L18 [Candidatus Berkelbacteria bacterium]